MLDDKFMYDDMADLDISSSGISSTVGNRRGLSAAVEALCDCGFVGSAFGSDTLSLLYWCRERRRGEERLVCRHDICVCEFSTILYRIYDLPRPLHGSVLMNILGRTRFSTAIRGAFGVIRFDGGARIV